MNSYRQVFYHIVFCTYMRGESLPEAHHDELYQYIWGIIKRRNCVLYRINGTENHIHIFSDLHSSVALADYVKEIKTASHRWMEESGKFPDFSYWAEGYCAITYNIRDKEMIIDYIKNQKIHHAKCSFEEEYKNNLDENGIVWDEKFVF